MENLKSWAASVVASVAVVTVVEWLVPEGGGEKPVKFITSVFVLLAFISPFSDFELPSLEYTDGIKDFVESHELEKQVEVQAKNSLETQIKSMLSAYVEDIGAVCESIEADVVISSDKEIYLDSITVYISGGDKEATGNIKEYSRENFGITPEVKYKE